MKDVNCNEVEPLLPATAAGALDQDEAQTVRAHLAICPPCLKHLHDYEHTVEQLAYVVPQVAPPSALRARVLHTITETAQASGPLHLPIVALNGWSPATAPPAPSRSRWISTYRRLAPAALAASLLVLVLGAGWAATLADQNSRMAQRLAQQDTVRSILHEPGAEMAALKPVAAGSSAGGQVIMAPGRRQVAVMVTRMPQPAAGRTYQLWLLNHGSGPPVSAGQLTVDGAGVIMSVLDTPADPNQMAGMRITDEPMTGSPAPTGVSWVEGWYK